MIFDNITFNNLVLVIKLIIMIIIPLIIFKATNKIVLKFQKKINIEDSSISGFTKVIRMITIIIVIVGCLDIIGINLSSLFVSVGLVTIAVSLIAKDLLSNFVSGLSIIIERKFKTDDIIEIGNKKGQVKKIGFKTVELLSDNELIIIPNVSFSQNSYVNHTTNGFYMQSMRLSINNDSLVDKNMEIIKNILDNTELILDNHNYEVFIENFDSDDVNLLINIPLTDISNGNYVVSKLLTKIRSEILCEKKDD